MRYHVFIEGPRDASAAGLEQLAASLAVRYGASPPAVLERLKQGRFCARSALDLSPAQQLAHELESLGAATSVVPDTDRSGAPQYASGLAAAFAGPGQGALALDLGVLGKPTVDLADIGWTLANVDGSDDPVAAVPASRAPVGAARPPAAPRPPAGPTRADGTAPPFHAGAAAVDGGDARPVTTRHAAAPPPVPARSPRAEPSRAPTTPPVARAGSHRPAPVSRGGQPHVLPAHGPHATQPVEPSRPAAAASVGGAEVIGRDVDLADSVVIADHGDGAVAPAYVPTPGRFEGSVPDSPAPDPFAPPSLDRTLPRLATMPIHLGGSVAGAMTAEEAAQLHATAAPGSSGSSILRSTLSARAIDSLGDSGRSRFLAGVVLAFLIGLVPAQLYAWSQADSAYADIQADLAAEYRAADTPEQWQKLPAARADAMALIDARRSRVVVSSCLLWAAVAGVVGFAWVRLVRARDPRRA